MATIRHEGVDYPVNDAWAVQNIDPWPELALMTLEDCDATRRALATRSNDTPLTPAERARLRALDNHFNARNAVKVLGAPDLAQFGFTGVDQLHGQRSTLPCGCELNHVFDHHIAMARAAAADAVDTAFKAGVARNFPMGKALAVGLSQRDADVAQARFEAHAELAGIKGDAESVAAMEAPFHPHTPSFLCEDHAPLEKTLGVADLVAQIQADQAAITDIEESVAQAIAAPSNG